MAMGGWFSRFRSHLTTKEQLEQIENDIQSIEDYKWSKLRQQKNLMALIFYGSGLLYTVVAILFYFCFLPLSHNLYDKCICSLPLIVLPAIAYLLQRSMQGYFRWVLENNEDRLLELRKEKRKILDKVMDTETYKVAKELLEKFDPSSLKPEKVEATPQRMTSPIGNQSIRFRGSPVPANTPAARHFMNTSNPTLNTSFSGAAPLMQQRQPVQQPMPQQQQMPYPPNRPSLMPPPRLVRPILPSERSVVEKMVDLVVGDGPNNRYALICCYCHSHNGMALKDEFEYLAFKCCYCNTYNPARKMRPFAPRIAAPAELVVEEPDSDTEKTETTEKAGDGGESDPPKEQTGENPEQDDGLKAGELTDDEEHSDLATERPADEKSNGHHAEL